MKLKQTTSKTAWCKAPEKCGKATILSYPVNLTL